MEHSSSSALLYLSHWLYLCTYYNDVYIMIKYNKPEPQLKRGICSFTSCEVTRSCSKAASGLPLESALLKASCYITWRIGRVQTNTMPLDRREPPDHLGTWSRLNQSRLLIGLRPQNHLGAWSNPNHDHAIWSA